MAVSFQKKRKPAAKGKNKKTHLISAGASVVQPHGGNKVQQGSEPYLFTDKPVSYVGFRAGKTTNIGSFESVKVEVWVSLPCPLGQEEEAYKTAQSFVDGKMASLLSELEAATPGAGGA